MALSSIDQQVWRKALAAKNQSMTEIQLATSLPALKPKEIQSALATLLKHQLMQVQLLPNGDRLYRARKEANRADSVILTTDQKLVKKIIEDSLDRGITMQKIKRAIPENTIPIATLRKMLMELEKSGIIKHFSAVSAPTSVLYHSSKYKPAADLTGGMWYDDKMEFDEALVDHVKEILLDQVRFLTFKGFERHDVRAGEPSTINRPLYTVNRTPKLPSPQVLVAYIKMKNVVQAQLGVREIMEVMRALELDGLVETIKPIGGMRDGDGSDDDNDGEPVKKRMKTNGGEAGSNEDDSMDEAEKDRKKELLKEKEKEKAKMRRKKEKERERAREKEKEKEKKKREKEKEREKKKKRKEKEKKEKEKKKKKKKSDSSDDSDSNADADSLVALSDLDGQDARSKSKSKSKSKKRSKSSSSSSSGSSSSSSSSDSDSDGSVSSVASSDIDNVNSKPRRNRPVFATGEAMVIPAGLQDLTDTHIVYRATNRLTVPLGQTEVPCGKCPVFSFCEESGPVNAESCEYWEGWLDGGKKGGWVGEDRPKPRDIEDERDEELNGHSEVEDGMLPY